MDRIKIRKSHTLLDTFALYMAGGRGRVMWVGRLHCRPLGTVHSTDRVRIERGRAPERMCGHHAAWI